MKKYIKLIHLNLSIALFSVTAYYGLDFIYTKIDENRSQSQHIKRTLDALINLDLIQPLLDGPALGVPLDDRQSGKDHAKNAFAHSLEKHQVRLVSLQGNKKQLGSFCKDYTCRLEAELDTDITNFLEEINESHKGYIAIQEVNLQRHENLALSTVSLKSYVAPKPEKAGDKQKTIKIISAPENLLFTQKESQTVLNKRQNRLFKSGACLHCTGYFHVNGNNWTAWINGKKITPTTASKLQNLTIKNAVPEGLHVRWTSKNKTHNILLKNTL